VYQGRILHAMHDERDASVTKLGSKREVCPHALTLFAFWIQKAVRIWFSESERENEASKTNLLSGERKMAEIAKLW